MISRYYIRLVWPSFMVAAIAEAIIFSLIAPDNILLSTNTEMSSIAVYTIVFFVLWSICVVSSALTMFTMPPEVIDEDGRDSF